MWRFCVLPLLCAAPVFAAGSWTQFRGPTGDGHSSETGLPLRWSESENVRWKTAIPGEGWSSPVVLNGRVWMTAALDGGKSLRAVCVAQDTGKILHNLEVLKVEAPRPKHDLNSYASPTPVVEPGRVIVSFGTYGMVCLDDTTGQVLWKNTSLTHDDGGNGPGSSPIIYGDLVIQHFDGIDIRYVAALDKKTGRQVWRTDRSKAITGSPEIRKAYSVPAIVQVDGRDQLISMGAYRVSSYDPLTGREIWWVDIPGFSNVTRPVVAHGLIYLATGFMKPELWAIRPGGTGDRTEANVVWRAKKQAPNKPHPVVVGERLFMVSDNGVATCLNALTGEEVWQERLGGEYSASPVVVDGRIYFFSQQGTVSVLAPEDKFRVLARSEVGGGYMASPAIVDKAFYLRSKTHLYRVEQAANLQ